MNTHDTLALSAWSLNSSRCRHNELSDKVLRTDRRAGVTLVEMMVASMLLIVVLTGFMSAFTVARRSAVMAQYEMQAVHTARQAIETLSACSYQDALLNVGSNKTLTGLSMSNTYSVVQNSAYPSTKDVRVTVYWTVPGMAKVWSMSMNSSFTACLH